MKKILILLALAIVALVGLPPVAGQVAETQINHALAQASDNGLITFNIRDYQRGWLSSSGLIELRLSEQYLQLLADMETDESGATSDSAGEGLSDLLDEAITLQLELTHGPVAIAQSPFLGWSTAVVTLNSENIELARLAEELELPYLLQLRTRTGFDGTTEFVAEVPPFDYMNELAEMSFTGLSIDGTFDGKQLITTGGTERFELDSLTAKIEVTDFRIAGDQENYAPFLWLGRTDISVGSIVTSSELEPELGQLEITDVGIYGQVSLSQTPEHVDMELRYQLGSMTGPDLDLSEVDVRLLVQQIDMASLELYYELNRDMVMTDPAALQERAPEMEAAMHAALSGSPSIALEPLSFQLNKQTFEAAIKLSVEGEKLPPREAWNINDTQAWTAITSMDAETKIARDLALQLATQTMLQQIMATSTPENPIDPAQAEQMAAQQAPAMLDVLVLQGMLTETEDGFAGTASYRDNTLTVNGEAVPLSF